MIGASNGLAVLIAGSLSLILASALVPIVRRLALSHGMVDLPGQGRAHRSPTPRLGGVAVVAAVILAALLAFPQLDIVLLVVAALLVALLGLVDDLRSVNPRTKLVVETGAALAAYSAGSRIELLGNPFDIVLTVIWLVALTNAYNFLDNMDGCAATVVGVTGALLVAAAVLEGNPLVAVLAASIVGAALGFGVYNWHPAKIFLGDVGSLFLGFLLAALALRLSFGGGPRLAGVILLAAPALLDMTLVIVSRRRAGQAVYIGGTDHTSHRLAKIGVPIPWVSASLAAFTLVAGSIGIAMAHDLIPPLAIAILAPSTVLLLWLLLRIPMAETSRMNADSDA